VVGGGIFQQGSQHQDLIRCGHFSQDNR